MLTRPEDSDLDQLYRLSKDHELTKITVCETVTEVVYGVTLTYGEWNSYGRVTNAKTLYTHGTDANDIGGSCSSFELEEGEYITKLKIGYMDEYGIAGLYFRTNKYNSVTFGTTAGSILHPNGSYYTVHTKTLYYGSSTRFYGFIGEEHRTWYSGA